MKQVTVFILAGLIIFGSLQPRSASAESYAIVARPGWSEGNLGWNCTVDYCAISAFVPSGGDCPICATSDYWDSTSLPLGAYYWLGSVSVLECRSDQWVAITTTPGWYFNYDPRVGDQSAVAGEPCFGSNLDANPDPGKSCPTIKL